MNWDTRAFYIFAIRCHAMMLTTEREEDVFFRNFTYPEHTMLEIHCTISPEIRLTELGEPSSTQNYNERWTQKLAHVHRPSNKHMLPPPHLSFVCVCFSYVFRAVCLQEVAFFFFRYASEHHYTMYTVTHLVPISRQTRTYAQTHSHKNKWFVSISSCPRTAQKYRMRQNNNSLRDSLPFVYKWFCTHF